MQSLYHRVHDRLKREFPDDADRVAKLNSSTNDEMLYYISINLTSILYEIESKGKEHD
jgi:hypothetical protein